MRDCCIVCKYCLCFILFFFFSSRRRHTRCLSDWSSDVCSSDLRSGCSSARNTNPIERYSSPNFGWERRNSDRSARKRKIPRSEEHTSELQSLRHLVCRLLLEKKKMMNTYSPTCKGVVVYCKRVS